MRRVTVGCLGLLALLGLMAIISANPHEGTCAPTILKIDDQVVTVDDLTFDQQTQVNASKIQCGFRYRRSPCLKEIRFYIKRQHTNVICTGAGYDEIH